ncbi:hypothetical protein T4B_5046 [Trichinella pseudospiralis]|uniref:Uncharacterized protein n=1 Tax=Trichinella pseudospiralis TaxID=6337 RepID=A0A0V1EQV3_TRIPS|nr:hypothetical protein T4A_5759 [Trichinella pseudospiralis]KRZ29127.1 hypothetical protein T4B_5046 [Trichinella pseudospiralis]KRZ40557.1 hypothetical protein T4C_2738 [Trichinella pseudospiralis]
MEFKTLKYFKLKYFKLKYFKLKYFKLKYFKLKYFKSLFLNGDLFKLFRKKKRFHKLGYLVISDVCDSNNNARQVSKNIANYATAVKNSKQQQ